MITRNIARPIFRSVSRSILRPTGENAVTRAINTARNALNIHPEQQTGSAYLVQKTPTLAGVVQDETPTRKDRTRLSCRASDFNGIAQYFTGGGTSAGKTALSAAIWAKVDSSITGQLHGEYQTSGDNRGWRIYLASGKPFVILSGDGTFNDTDCEKVVTVDALENNVWNHIVFTWSVAADEVLIYVNGKSVTVAVASNPSIASIFNSTQDYQIGVFGAGADAFDGQLQQPLIYEGVWSAAQVRDLYLQQVDDIPTTYGWFLDGDTASGLTSSSPALSPTNSPDIYEDDAIGGGDWLNEKGYNLSGVDPIPKRWDEELDSLGNAADNSESFGVARRDGQLVGSSNCISLDGVNQYGVVADDDIFSFGDGSTDSPFSISCEVVFASGSEKGGLISKANDINSAAEWLLSIGDSGNVSFVLYDSNVNNSIKSVSDTTLQNDTKYSILATYDGSGSESGLTIYVDELAPSQTRSKTGTYVAMEASSKDVEIGVTLRTGGSFFRYFDGQIWDVRIYDSEVTPSTMDTVDPIAHWPIAEGSGSVSYDVSGNKNCTWQNSADWGNQSQYFWNENQGCSLYEHATSPDILVPFGSDGSALTITPPSGYTKTSDNPAGPWLYEGLGDTYVNFDVIPNANQWLEQRWQDTEGDNVGYLTLTNQVDLTGVFDIEFLLTTSDTTGTILSKADVGAVPKIHFNSGNCFIRVVSSSDDTVAQPSLGVEHQFKLSRDASDVVTLTIDGTENTLYSGAAQVGTMELQTIFSANTLDILSGTLRNLKIIDDGTTVLDFDSLIDLDLSSSLNNATETATDITYNRLTDVSYQAGDTVEQPFSVNDDTAGRVSELINFIFPVTTLSNTPTISQTVYEDGNTLTEDSILISES